MRLRVVATLMLVMVLGGAGSAGALPDPVETACAIAGVPEPDVSQLQAPPAPDLSAFYRETSGPRSDWEEATFSGGQWWTRRGGDDIVVKLGNARSGYTLHIYDATMQPLHSERVSLCDPFVRVPLPTAEGVQNRVFVFTSGAGQSSTSRASFGVDLTPPVIASEVRTGVSTARVVFSEPVEGRDYASDWYASASFDFGTQYTMATSVAQISATTRDVHFEAGPLEGGTFNGVDYLFSGPEDERYHDAAGNVVADTLS